MKKLREKEAASPDAVSTMVPIPPPPGIATAASAAAPPGACAAASSAGNPAAAPGIAIVSAVGGARGGRPADGKPGGELEVRRPAAAPAATAAAAAWAIGEFAPRRSELPCVPSPKSRDCERITGHNTRGDISNAAEIQPARATDGETFAEHSQRLCEWCADPRRDGGHSGGER